MKVAGFSSITVRNLNLTIKVKLSLPSFNEVIIIEVSFWVKCRISISVLLLIFMNMEEEIVFVLKLIVLLVHC